MWLLWRCETINYRWNQYIKRKMIKKKQLYSVDLYFQVGCMALQQGSTLTMIRRDRRRIMLLKTGDIVRAPEHSEYICRVHLRWAMIHNSFPSWAGIKLRISVSKREALLWVRKKSFWWFPCQGWHGGLETRGTGTVSHQKAFAEFWGSAGGSWGGKVQKLWCTDLKISPMRGGIPYINQRFPLRHLPILKPGGTGDYKVNKAATGSNWSHQLFDLCDTDDTSRRLLHHRI